MGSADAGDQGGNKGYCVPVKLAAEKTNFPGFSNSKSSGIFKRLGLMCGGSLRTIMRDRFVPKGDI